MRKILFNDKYGLTESVLKCRKTMTRRVIKDKKIIYSLQESEYYGGCFSEQHFHCYKVGEIVAIAQSYSQIHSEYEIRSQGAHKIRRLYSDTAGWNNKMFVKADLMPHHIRITNIKVERLQDISDEDALNEGIITDFRLQSMSTKYYIPNQPTVDFTEPREAFAALIDKVSGKGTWESNPYVLAYTFELVK